MSVGTTTTHSLLPLSACGTEVETGATRSARDAGTDETNNNNMKPKHITIGSLALCAMDAIIIGTTDNVWFITAAGVLLLGTYLLAFVSLGQEVSE